MKTRPLRTSAQALLGARRRVAAPATVRMALLAKWLANGWLSSAFSTHKPLLP